MHFLRLWLTNQNKIVNSISSKARTIFAEDPVQDNTNSVPSTGLRIHTSQTHLRHSCSDYRARNLFNSENSVSKTLNSTNEAIDHLKEVVNNTKPD